MSLFDRKGRPTKRMLEQRSIGFSNVVVYALDRSFRNARDRQNILDFAMHWLADSGLPGNLPPSLESRNEAYGYATQRLGDLWNRRDAVEVIRDLEAYLVGAFPDEPPIMQSGGPVTLYSMALFHAFTAEVVADHYAPFGPQRREQVIDEAARALVSLGVRYRDSL